MDDIIVEKGLQPDDMARMDRIETDRLVLRYPVYDDASRLFDLISDPVACRFNPNGAAAKPNDMPLLIAFWQEQRAANLHVFMIAHRDRPLNPIGLIQVTSDEEIGGMIAPAHGAQGYAVEAIRGLINRFSLRRIWCIVDAEDHGLAKTLAAVDVLPEKRLPSYRVHPLISSQKRDCVLYRQKTV